MYLAVDIGGTKTLLASFNGKGKLIDSIKFPTPKRYPTFLHDLKHYLFLLGPLDYQAAGVAIPGKVDRKHGRGIAFGNLEWKNVPIEADIQAIVDAPIIIENDAKLAGLSEAKLIIKDFKRVLYVTISTGIGVGIITNGIIDSNLADSEGGHMLLEYRGKLVTWETLASGKAIVKKYRQKAAEITDPAAWDDISRKIALGLINLIAVLQPEVIVIGGGVGAHFNKFKSPLGEYLKKYEMPMVRIPPIRQAAHPEDAVIYGAYDLAKAKFGHKN